MVKRKTTQNFKESLTELFKIKLRNFVFGGGRIINYANWQVFFTVTLHRACSKMKKAQWGFSFKKSKIHFLKQLCLYFNYIELTV